MAGRGLGPTQNNRGKGLRFPLVRPRLAAEVGAPWISACQRRRNCSKTRRPMVLAGATRRRTRQGEKAQEVIDATCSGHRSRLC